MKDIIVRIMVEVLSALALARKQIKDGRFKKFAKKLLGESEVEAVLIRLERLTQEEARMTGAHILEVVHGLMNNVKIAMDDGKVSVDSIRQSLVVMQEIAEGINKIKRDQLQKDVRTWFSPPDPSDNHIIARKSYRGGTAVWFAQGSTFEKWMMEGSLMWIHGKAGSGKSVLCSTVMEQAKTLRDAGLGLIAYFYFDFRDPAKQDVRGLLSSLLVQFAARSDPCHHKLFTLYSKYDDGLEKPDDDVLIQCLEDVLKMRGRPAMYIIVDGLDECPNNIGIISPRQQVLEFVKRLVNFSKDLSKDLSRDLSEDLSVHICITSRPEADIRAALEPMASHSVSLHDESGQKQDIITYIKYEVQRIKKWRPEDKKLVIDTLSEKADGMFRWVVCQLERLCRSTPASISHALGELPGTLDETYERSLLTIDEVNRPFARRLLHCLAVSARPLRVEELAEIFAVGFDDGQRSEYRPRFRPQDAQEAVLSACPSLVAVVNVDGSLVVRFSHFSVKEFLTSDRLAKAEEKLSYYHILPRPAHTILAQTSLCVLLHLDSRIDKDSMKDLPLASYAARHWVDHIPFKNITPIVQSAMEHLFDPVKPHFEAWVRLYDLDHPWAEDTSEARRTRPPAVPLYYAALSGFHNLVKYLIATCPHNVNARGGYYVTPLHAAIAKGHVDITLLLLQERWGCELIGQRRPDSTTSSITKRKL
ncbi:hypothetical protein EDB92DRAFT_1129088 [Lactarius akahatsu]|uniref:NACHT domain-containing protein n=1 Tax=Lactarius akahatsu TaxID=416441 RepID=A0AAD4LDX5_9AGAM|nr:hypothetical protein EDB92DRAFT_1129088 [Lactarius akahatsu]